VDTIGRKTECAYRRKLMSDWAAYRELPPQGDNVIEMKRIKPIPA
jgi:hypothetical protein